jgi:hypothetical protein
MKTKLVVKERSMGELRQTKDSVYTPPISHFKFTKDSVRFDNEFLVKLIKENPNDKSLGELVRNYYNILKNHKK